MTIWWTATVKDGGTRIHSPTPPPPTTQTITTTQTTVKKTEKTYTEKREWDTHFSKYGDN